MANVLTRAATSARNQSIDWTVFGVSFGIIAAICAAGLLFTDTVATVSGAALDWVVASFGWLLILASTGFVIFSVVLAFSRYGRIPLSRNGEPPEFSTVSWVAMMFSAGMGIGLMFYGVYEPVTHLVNPPPFIDAPPGSPQAAQHAMAYTFFHWTLHPWAIYSVMGLALAYSTYRMGRGNLVSSPFQALFGKERMEDKGWGKPIDILAIVTTKFGSATSLGLGALQIAAGISLLRTGVFADEPSVGIAISVICVLTVFIILSAASGVARGIKWLSNINMVLAALLVLFVFVVGPTIFILNLIPSAVGSYVSNLVPMSFNSATYTDGDWLATWTIFYWAWWISWTPFVGTFIARISRGRTIREFVLGVMLVPSVVSALWFIVFGGAGIHLQLNGVDVAGRGNEAAAFFAFLQEFPFFTVTAILVIILTSIFFVSGADAGALVLATLSSRGRTEPWTPLVVLWAVLTGAVAGVLLLVDGLAALQTFTILAATPFVLILIGLCIALWVDLSRDPLRERRVGPIRGHVPPPAVAAGARQSEAPAPSTGDAPKQAGAAAGRGPPRPAGVSVGADTRPHD
ncbi:MAG: BCCT family transporter [Pseudonocardia sp.]|nr:BCCT family transporter [Pseudonocardia sp.]